MRLGTILGIAALSLLLLASPVRNLATTGETTVFVNTPTVFAGSGYDPNEAVSFWATASNDDITPLPNARTDNGGAFQISVSFPYVGHWTVTAHSIHTGREDVGYYNVIAAPPPPNAVPQPKPLAAANGSPSMIPNPKPSAPLAPSAPQPHPSGR